MCIFSDGHLSRFINYGYGSLQPVEGIQTHNKLVLGVNLEACAQLCLAETTFKCASFDYVFGEQSCQMSHLIAANVHGMRTQFDTPHQVMHFELIGKKLLRFAKHVMEGTFNIHVIKPGAVARSDARPRGMRTVEGSILTSVNILSWRLVMN